MSLRQRVCAAAIVGASILLTGCSTSDNVSVHGSVGMYYGGGYYDPWYYGPRYGPPVVVVPPNRPDRPVTRPPPTRPRPLPARPTPRPMPRGR